MMDVMEEAVLGGNPGTGHTGPVIAAIFPPLIDICLIYCPDTAHRRGRCVKCSHWIVLRLQIDFHCMDCC